MACGLAVLWSVDVLAFTVRRPSLVALPLLVTLSIPVTILQGPLALPVFIGTALLFLRLLAHEHLEKFRTWGAGSTKADQPALNVLWQVSVVAVVVALLTAPLVPVADLLDQQPGDGNGTSGSSIQLSAVNPFVRLRRDLVEKTHTPLVYARTDALSTSYLRTTVLDEFTSVDWRPSPRNLPDSNAADGAFPNAPGLLPGSGGRTDTWSLQLAPYFTTTWLPLPYPILDLHVRGGWRYDSRTLDVALTGRAAPPALSYTATAFSPTIDCADARGGREGAPQGAQADDRGAARPARGDQDPGPRGDQGRRPPTSPRRWRCRTGSANGGGFRYSLQQRSRVRDGSPRRLRHRRPGRLLRAVRRGDGSHGPRTGHPLAGRRGLPGRYDAVGRPDPLHQRRAARLAGDVLHAASGWVRFEPTPSAAHRSVTGVHPAGRHRTDTDAGAQRGRHPEVITGGGGSRRREGEEGPGVERPVVAGRDAAGAGAARGRTGAGPRGPATTPALRHRSGAPGRGRLGRAARHGPGPRAGVARTAAPRGTRRAAWSPRSPRKPRRCARSRACWCRWSGVATPARDRPGCEDDRVTPRRRPPWSTRSGRAPSRPWSTGAGAWSSSVDRERGWRRRLWPVSVVRRRG